MLVVPKVIYATSSQNSSFSSGAIFKWGIFLRFFSFTFFKTHRSLFSSNFSYISLPYRNVNYFIYYAVAKTKYEMKQITTGDHDSGPGRSVQLLYIFSQCDFPFVNANPHHHQSNMNSEHWTVIVGTNANYHLTSTLCASIRSFSYLDSMLIMSVCRLLTRASYFEITSSATSSLLSMLVFAKFKVLSWKTTSIEYLRNMKIPVFYFFF